MKHEVIENKDNAEPIDSDWSTADRDRLAEIRRMVNEWAQDYDKKFDELYDYHDNQGRLSGAEIKQLVYRDIGTRDEYLQGFWGEHPELLNEFRYLGMREPSDRTD